MLEITESLEDSKNTIQTLLFVFSTAASHELKTPLTVIESYASMLKRWGRKKPELLDESIEAIYSEAVRMKEMTE